MAQNPANIHIGAARIFLGVSPPVTGNPPTLLVHSDGVPLTGIEVGYTQDATTFTYKQNKQEVLAEQSLNPVDVFVVNEEIQIEFNAMEHVYTTLKAAFDNVGSLDDNSKTLFYGGDSAGLVSVTTQCVTLTSRIRTAPTKFEVLTIYKVYNVEGIVVPYNRTGVALYKVTLKGLVDPNRVAGDRLFQWYREKGAVTATGATSGTPGSFTPPGSGVPQNLSAMGPVTASPLTAWTPAGSYVQLGDGTKAYWNGVAWASGTALALATGATAGSPGTFTPPGSLTPPNLAAMTTPPVTATPSTVWGVNQYVVLADASHVHWSGTAWVTGDGTGTFMARGGNGEKSGNGGTEKGAEKPGPADDKGPGR